MALPQPSYFPVSVDVGPSRPAMAAPVTAPPPMDMPAFDMRGGDNWGSLVDRAIGLANDLYNDKSEKGGDFSKFMRSIDEQMALMKADRARLEEALAKSSDSAAAEPTDVDEYMRRNARFESGNDPGVVNKGSGATGLYQFLPSTWRGLMTEAPHLGLTEEGIKDAEQQNKAMRYYTDKSASILKSILGRKPTGGELYLLHLLGHAGGPAVIRNVDAPITETIGGAAYSSNPFLGQYKTGRDLIAGLNRRFGG